MMTIPLYKMIQEACVFAFESHGDTPDDEGKNYFMAHVSHVVGIVKRVTTDPEIIAAAYLHDTIEDCRVTYEEIKEKFGIRVADLVMELTHEGEKDNYGYYFPRLKSRDAIMIKLADRMSNISRMEAWSENRREHYLRSTRFWKNGEDRHERNSSRKSTAGGN